MASLKAQKPVCAQPVGQAKKEPAAKAGEGASKTAGSKSVATKKSAQKPQEPKKKGKGGKSAGKCS